MTFSEPSGNYIEQLWLNRTFMAITLAFSLQHYYQSCIVAGNANYPPTLATLVIQADFKLIYRFKGFLPEKSISLYHILYVY